MPLALLVAPLAILAGNARVEPARALLEGLGWYALLPGVGGHRGGGRDGGGLVARAASAGRWSARRWWWGRSPGAWSVSTELAVFGYDPFAG